MDALIKRINTSFATFGSKFNQALVDRLVQANTALDGISEKSVVLADAFEATAKNVNTGLVSRFGKINAELEASSASAARLATSMQSIASSSVATHVPSVPGSHVRPGRPGGSWLGGP